MSEPIRSRKQPSNEYDGATGGYCAADGSIQYSSGPAASTSKRPSSPAAPPAPRRPASVEQLAKGASKKPPLHRVALIERKRSNAELSVMTASAGTGRSLDASASVVEARLPLSASNQVKATAGSAKVVAGTSPPDGSTGVSVGAGVSVAAAEWSYSSGASSMSIGVDVGASAGLSVGKRDADGNGVPETCWGAEVGLMSIAVCAEDAAPPQNDGPRTGARGAGGKTHSGGSGGTSGW